MFKTKLAKEIWESKYKFGDETPLQTFERVAHALASVEKNPEEWYDKFLNTLVRFDNNRNPTGLKCTTGGRITANIGTSFKKATLLNCFISGPVSNAHVTYKRKTENGLIEFPVEYSTGDSPDDLINIFLTIVEQAKTLASEGGYGINFDFIRPRGSLIKGTGIKHPGVVAYMEIWNAVSECIVQGDADGYVDKIKNYLKDDEKFNEIKEIVKNAIRKGAQIGVLSVTHPDCEEFVRAKQTSGVLTKFNISVLLTDDFMKAVENDEFFEQSFNGVVIKKIKAKELYKLIMKSCYDRAEPGVLFADNMMKNNPIAYMGRPNSTNPSLRKGTKVLTNSGIESIENLEGKKFKVQNLYGDWVSAECFFSGKDKPLYDIEFASGNNILATPEHKWPVMTTTGGWAKLETSNLNKGDIIPFLNSNCEGLNINNDLSRDEGLMLGWLYGDGWIHIKEDGDRHEYGFFFNKNEYYIAEKILSIVNSFKDTKSNINTDKDGNFVFQVSSNIFHTYMKNMGVQGKDNGFPIIIWKSNINFILGFLDGLISSDGYIGTKLCPTLTLVTSHDKMAKDYADLMGFLGVRSKSRKTITKKPSFPNKKCYNKKNYIRFDISTNGSHLGDLKKVGFSLFHKEKNEKFNVACDTIITRRRQDYGRNYIRGVKLTNLKEDVWDITVHDDTHCFRVGCGITGNCGEIPGLSSITTVCLLGSLNLTQYVKIRSSGEVYFDFEEYKEDIKVFMRMLDNVNDLTYTPLPAYQWAVENLRQVGMGINGLGSTLMMLSIPYNSKDAIEFTKKICQLKEDLTWQTSALLAKEKGTFGAYIKEEFESTEYFKSDRITEETKELIRKYGVRNSKTTTCPPLGNCVVGTTEIVTSEGNIRIKDIFMENGITDKDISNKWYLPLKDIYVKTLRGYKRVVGYYLNKKDEVLTIATNNNNKIKGTRNHKVLVKVSDTSAKWVKLDDLKVGQKILLARPPIIF